MRLLARGLSARDIEDTFTVESGRRLLSRTAVSEITERLWAEGLTMKTAILSHKDMVNHCAASGYALI